MINDPSSEREEKSENACSSHKAYELPYTQDAGCPPGTLLLVHRQYTIVNVPSFPVIFDAVRAKCFETLTAYQVA